MSDIPAPILLNYFLYLFIPFIVAYVLKKNRISPIIGYIFGGIILSNLMGGLISKDVMSHFAYFGIMLLLFTVGLEIQFDRLLTVKKFILLGGFLQLILSSVVISIFSAIFGFNLIQSFLIGIAFSSSSTALVAKIIQDRGEENSFLGEITIGMLMFQDLAFIPFMIIFTSLTAKNTALGDVGLKILLGVLFSFAILGIAYYLGKIIVPFIFNKVARTSRELLNLFIFLFIFFVAYLSTVFHVPILVSIFVAGILISQTLEHYHIFTQIRPIRDLLAIIFFIFIGMSINIALVPPLFFKIILFAAGVIIIKALIILIIFLFFRFHSKTCLYLSVFLFQIDEDAFILTSLAFMNGIFNQEQYVFIVSTVLLTLVATPILINQKEAIYLKIRGFINKRLPSLSKFIRYRVDSSLSPIDVLNIKDHVIICGYGRMGWHIGRALMLANVNFVAIDYNLHTVEKAKKEGANIIYGDPTDIDILDYAECEHARILISVVPERMSQEMIVLNAKKLNPKIILLTRVNREEDRIRMRDMGVRMVVQPEFEASLSIIRRILFFSGLEKEEIAEKIKLIKMEYGML